jgi:phage-related protein
MVECSCKLNNLVPYKKKDGTLTVSVSLTFESKDAESWREIFDKVSQMLESVAEK